jgi:hypothetical protein
MFTQGKPPLPCSSVASPFLLPVARLAAQHRLDLLRRRDQLVGLALRDALADMRLDEPDEICEFAAGGGRLPATDSRQHIL